MTRFQVDSEAAAGVAASMRGTIERVRSECAALHAQLSELQSSWTGSASAAFQGVVGEWRSTQQRVEESLTSINTALDRSVQSYVDVEQQNAALFR